MDTLKLTESTFEYGLINLEIFMLGLEYKKFRIKHTNPAETNDWNKA